VLLVVTTTLPVLKKIRAGEHDGRSPGDD